MAHDDIIEDYSSIRVGDTGAKFIPHFRDKEKRAIDLTDATLSLLLQRESPAPAIVKEATGEWEYLDRVNGIAQFHYSEEDVDTEGLWNMIIGIEIDGEMEHADAKRLRILPLPEVEP